MRWAVPFILLMLLASFSDTRPEKEIKLKNLDYFTIDQFSNIYGIRFDQLRKYDSNGKIIFEYSNPLLGSIHSLSALDPLNLLLFYKDQAQITTLDNRLNESTAIQLIDIGLNDVQLVSQSDENFVWVYDQATDRLYRLDLNRASISNKSLNITQLVQLENQPTQLESTYDNVFLNIPEKGILIFDATGSLLQTVALKHVDYFDVWGERIFYLKQDTVRSIDFKKNTMGKQLWPLEEVLSFTVEARKLYVLKPKKLNIYGINP